MSEQIRCAVFLDSLYESYFELLLQGLKEEYTITQVFSVEDLGKAELSGYALFPLRIIMDAEPFEAAVILCQQHENIEKLVKAAFQNINCTFVSFTSIPEVLLNDVGKMCFLKHYIERTHSTLAPPNVIGDFSYSTNLSLYSEDPDCKCIIGKFSAIGPDNTFLMGEEHHVNWATCFPLSPFYGDMIRTPNITTFSKGDIVIGNDVWTGYGVTVLSGVKIGDGCVIGAETVVTKSVEPYSIVCGNPGRVIRKRFSDEAISKLMEMKWWDWDYAHIYRARNLLQSEDIDALYRYFKNMKEKSK